MAACLPTAHRRPQQQLQQKPLAGQQPHPPHRGRGASVVACAKAKKGGGSDKADKGGKGGGGGSSSKESVDGDAIEKEAKKDAVRSRR